MADIAFLVYKPMKSKKASFSFDAQDNIGAYVVKELLQRQDIQIEFCAPETAKNFRIVLVSLTSTYDIYAFYRSVALRPEWQLGKRKFIVIAGGFGMQNPSIIRNYIDYAVFGRAEGLIEPMMVALLGGEQDFIHESVMHLPHINNVKIRQAQKLIDVMVDIKGGKKQWQESFIDCPNKCKFCNYTWSRKHIGKAGQYIQDAYTGGGSPEVLWKDLLLWPSKAGRLRTAIDGFSERLRFNFGKRITTDEITKGINHIGSFNGNTVLIAYNISNMPGEGEQDRQELYEAIIKARPDNRVIFIIHSTPFRPSPATPMAHCEVNLSPHWHNKIGKDAVIIDIPNLLSMHSRQMESPRSHLETVVVERATSKSDKLFHAICFSPKLRGARSDEWLRLVKNNFDITPYIRRYDPDEKIPTWFLSGWCKEMDKAIRQVDKTL